MKRNVLIIVIIAGLVLTMSRCNKTSQYKQMVQNGLASNLRNDTIFLGLYLGMSSKDFYNACWEMNKQGLVRQGTGNITVLHELQDELKATVDVNFYPTFFEDKIYEMPVTFQYKAWAPWNRQFSADTLHIELRDIFEQWYGKGFLNVIHPEKGKAFIKVDGNRRIILYKSIHDDGIVWALYTDLSVDEQAKRALKEKE